MSSSTTPTRSLPLVLLVLLCALVVPLLLPASAAASYSNTRATAGQLYSPERTISFAAGTHTGYTFDSYGNTTGSKASTLPSSSSAPASHRRYINTSWYYYITAGVWDGYWVPDNANINANQGDKTVSSSRTVNVSVNWSGNSVNPGTITIYRTQSSGAPSTSTATSCGTLSPAAQSGDYHATTCTLPSDGLWKFFTLGVGESLAGSYDSTVFIDTVNPDAPSLTCTDCSAGTRHYQSAANAPIYFRTGGLSGTDSLALTAGASDASPSSGIYAAKFETIGGGWAVSPGVNAYDTTSPYQQTMTFDAADSGTTQRIEIWDDATRQGARTLTLTEDNTPPTFAWVSPTSQQYQSGSSFTFDWNTSDPSGAGVRYTHRVSQVAATNGSGGCGTFTNQTDFGTSTSTAQAVTSMNAGNCYRMAARVFDNLDNVTGWFYSYPIVGDDSAPTHAVSVHSSPGDSVHRTGNTVWFNPAGVPSSTQITVDGSDAQSGINGASIESTQGWAVYEPGDPTVYPISWNYGEPAFDVTTSVDNNSGLSSPEHTLNFTPDTSAPAVTISTPASGTAASASGDITLAWTESDPETGIASRSVQRERATATDGTCGSFNADGTVSTAVSPRTDTGLASGYCYQYVVYVENNVGAGSPITSGIVIVDTAMLDPAFVAPATDSAQAGSSFDVSWEGDSAAAGIISRSLQREVADADAGSCSTFVADGTPSTGVSPRNETGLLDGKCYRWTLTVESVLDTASVTSDVVIIDAATPVLTVTTPEPATTVATDETSVDVTWSASAASGISATSVQRYVAPASAGDCGVFAADGAATTTASPRNDTDLLAGNCYRWKVTVTNAAGGSANDYTGVLLIDDETPSAEFTEPIDPTSGEVTWDADGELAVTWTEDAGVSGIASRSLQHQTAPFDGVNSCGAFSNAGEPATTASPVPTTIDNAGCHRWVLTLTGGSGLVGTATSPAVAVDTGTPQLGFDFPVTDLRQPVTEDFELEWTETDDGVIVSRSLQREMATPSFPNGCAAATFAADGAPLTSATSPHEVTDLVDGACYRWQLTVIDASGQSASDTSAVLYTDPAPASSAEFTNPVDDTETIFASDFTDPDTHIGFPGTRAQEANGNWRGVTSSGRTGGERYGAIMPTETTLHRLGGNFTSSGDGANSSLELCFYDASDVLLSCGAKIQTQDVDFSVYRTATVNAPTGTAGVAVHTSDYFTTSYFDNVLIERVLTSDTSAVQISDSVDVAWTEDTPPLGQAIVARSLQRQVATATNLVGCAAASFSNDGAPIVDDASPIAESGLASNKCYRWVVTLTDADGNSGSTTSGVRYVVDHQLDVRHVPTAGVGNSVAVSAVLLNRAGNPMDDFAGVLTISTSDPNATFPGGATYTMDGADDQTGHTFEVEFGSVGEHTITVVGVNAQVTTSSIEITASELVAEAPATVYAGVPFMFEVTPTRNGSYDPRYTGTVQFSSSDTTATWSRTTGTPPSFDFDCNCEGSETFATRLTTLGAQSITVTDTHGNTDTVNVEVLAAPGDTVPSPVQRIDRVKWEHGNTVDWYITAVDGAQPFTVLEVTSSCGPAWGANVRVLPTQDRFVEFTSTVSVPICDDAWLNEPGHSLIIVDDVGHTWTLSANGSYRRFASVPGASNFKMLDPGDPVAYWQATQRPGGSLLATGPNGRRYAYGMNSLELEFYLYEPATLIEMALGRSGITGMGLGANVKPWLSPQTRVMGVGQNFVRLDDITHTCYISGSMQGTDNGWITYGTGTGRTGSIAQGGGILPGAGSPTATCSDPSNTDGGSPLDDLMDALNPDNWPLVGDISRFMAGDPIDPFTGGFTQTVSDFSLGGMSPSLQLNRTYRADRAEKAAMGDVNAAAGIFGPGWGSSIDQRLVVRDSGARVEWIASDGGVSVFIRDGAGNYAGTRSDVTLSEISGSYRLETNSGSALLFNASGRLTEIKDRDGRSMIFAYDGAGHLDSYTDAASRTADVSVDGTGRVTRVDLPDGRYVAFTYVDGYLASARSLSGTVISYVTDSRGRLTELRDAADKLLLRNVYDDAGRVISQDDATGNTTWFTYDAGGLMTSVLDERGAVTTDCFIATGQLDHRIDALGNTTRYTYDAAGNPSSTTDALGRVTTFTYNADALPTTVTDPLGRTQTIAYNAEGLVTKVTDHSGNTVTPSYDAAGRPDAVVQAEPTSDPDPQSQTVATYTYNALGLPETITTPGGAGATMSYNSTGYLTGVTDAEGRQITYTVDARGFVTATVDPLGNAAGGVPSEHTSTYTYDDAGRVLNATNAENETTTFTYDEMGRLLTTTSPLGTVTTNVYDDDGRVLSTTTQLNSSETATTTFEYDVVGNLIRITDAEDRETEFEYDLLGRQTLQRDPNGEEWLTEYDALGRVTKTTDPTGRTSQTFYDAAGRVSKTVDPAGEETTYSYNDRDQLVTITDPLGRVTTNTYDWLGRQTHLTNAENETTISAFNAAGDLVSMTDAEGKTTTFSYDDTHRLLEVVDAATGSTTFEYDAAGRLIERTNARGKSETFAYDAVGRQTRTTDALGNEWETHYDADGRIDFTVDGMGQITEFTFDRAGRLTSVDPHGSMAPITYIYDDTGRQLSMSDAEGTSTFAYDAVGRITSAVRDSQTVGYTYDAAGRPTSVVYPGSSGSVDYTYDSAGRLATISDWADRTTTMTYDDASRITSMARPGGLATNFVYDDVNRLLGIDHLQGAGALLELDYTYDDVGNVLTYTDDTGTATFGYNDLHQLTSADYPGTNDYTYTYDAVSNMTQMAGPTGALNRTFNDGDQMVSETATGSFTETIAAAAASGAWTDMTNLAASDDVDAVAAPAVGETLTMNVDDFDFSSVPVDALISEVTVNVEWASDLATAELTMGAQARVDGTLVGTETTETTNPTTDVMASFTVAGLDRADLELLTIDIRASRVAGDPVIASVDAVTVEVSYTLPPRNFTYDNNGSMTDDGAGRTFTYDTMGRLTGVNGAVDAAYRYDGAGRRIGATIDGVSTDYLLDIRGMGSVLSDGTNRFLPAGPNAGYETNGVWVNALANHQGTVLGYADANGLVGSLTHFDPYGSVLPGSAAPMTGPGFTGEWTDATGLVNLRFRAYDPTLQAFFGRDTFGGVASAPLSGNRYAYAMGNPLRYTDPSGHFVNEFMRDPGLYLSIGLQMIPGIGDAYSLATGAMGYDPIAGMTLSGIERGLAMAAALPFMPNLGRFAHSPGDNLVASADGFAAKTFGDAFHNPTLSGRARIEAFDTLQHSRRTGLMMESAAKFAGGNPSTWRAAGILHDTGKAGRATDGTPILEIISRPGRLDDASRRSMDLHASIGADVIRNRFGNEIANAAGAHHMYNAPGLTDMQKFLQGADTYDALRSARAYKEGFEHVRAIDIMRSDAKVAPNVVEFFDAYGPGLHTDASGLYPGAYIQNIQLPFGL